MTGTLRRALEVAESCLEPPPHVERYLRDFDPDVVVVTHLARDSVQVDYVRAAKRLGLHTVYPVFSWDNLSNKGLVHEVPELVLVWNELQADEAVELQSLPRELVRVLGAWSYDHWFEWEPSRSRRRVLRRGRAEGRTGRSSCTSARRASSRRTRSRSCAAGSPPCASAEDRSPRPGSSCGLTRATPAQWSGVSLDDAQATVWPQLGEEPLEVVSRRNYFDSIYHSAAVVGINTSAQIESAVVGRPGAHGAGGRVPRRPSRARSTSSTSRRTSSGTCYVGRTIDEHLEQLEESVRGRDDDGRNERFLRRFVRPLGLDVAATPRYVESIEELAARPAPARDRGPALAPLVRLALAPLAGLVGRRAERGRARRQGGKPADELRASVRRARARRSRAPGRRRSVARRRGRRAPVLDPVPALGADGDLRPARPAGRRLARRRGVVVRGDRLAPGSPPRRSLEADRLAALAASFPGGDLDAARRGPGAARSARKRSRSSSRRSSHARRHELAAAGSRAELQPPAARVRRASRCPPSPDGLELPAEFVAVSSADGAARARLGREPGGARSQRAGGRARAGRAGSSGRGGSRRSSRLLVGVPAVVVGAGRRGRSAARVVVRPAVRRSGPCRWSRRARSPGRSGGCWPARSERSRVSSVRRLLRSPAPAGPSWERLSELEEYRELCRVRLEHVVPVREPLVLVSQIQRSGGTLLSQLFDGHPECHSHPYELKIGHPRKYNWPPLDLGAARDVVRDAVREAVGHAFPAASYNKSAKRRNDFDVFPFLFLPRLQKAMFEACVEGRRPERERDVLDCYFTSYFNAWLDNQNLYSGPKRVVTGFTPRLAMEPGNVERFFAAYPDGMADLDRPRPARLVRLRVRLPARPLRRRRGGAGLVAALDGGGGGGAGAVRGAGGGVDVRAVGAGDGAGDAARWRSGWGSRWCRCCCGRRSTGVRSGRTRVGRWAATGCCRSG